MAATAETTESVTGITTEFVDCLLDLLLLPFLWIAGQD